MIDIVLSLYSIEIYKRVQEHDGDSSRASRIASACGHDVPGVVIVFDKKAGLNWPSHPTGARFASRAPGTGTARDSDGAHWQERFGTTPLCIKEREG